MGAVRYRCDFYSDGGQQWRVDIYDSASSVGSPADFNIFGTGFDLSYKGTDSETYSPLLASEVKLYFAIEDSDAQDMLMEILNTNEKRFFIQIYKGASRNYYWSGTILQDLGSLVDESLPSLVTITAIDGIGTLQNTTFGAEEVAQDMEYPNYSSYGPNSFATLIDLVGEAVARCSLSGHVATASSLNPLLYTSVNFYEHNMASGTPATSLDPLALTKVKHGAFVDFPENATDYAKGKTWFEVMKQLCLVFNARFFLSNGKWYFENINQYSAGSTLNFRKYDIVPVWNVDYSTSYGEGWTIIYQWSLNSISTTYVSTDVVNIKNTANSADPTQYYTFLSNPNRTYHPPLLKIDRSFIRKNAGDILPYQSTYNLGSSEMLVTNDGQSLREGADSLNIKFEGYVRITNDSGGSKNLDYLILGFAIQLKDTDSGDEMFLNNSYQNAITFTGNVHLSDGPEWTDTTANYEGRYYHLIVINRTVDAGATIIPTFDFEIATPSFEHDFDQLTFFVHNYGFTESDSPLEFDPKGISSVYPYFNQAHMYLMTDGEAFDDVTHYTAWNGGDNAVNTNSMQDEVTDSLIGDSPDVYSDGKLWIKNYSGNWVESNHWDIQEFSPPNLYDSIINCQLWEIMELRTTLNAKLNAQVRGYIDIFKKFDYDSSEWLLSSATLSASDDIWSVQMFQIDNVINNDITNEANGTKPLLPLDVYGNLNPPKTKIPQVMNDGYKFIANTTNNTKTEIFLNGKNNSRLNIKNNSAGAFIAKAVGVLVDGSNKGDSIVIDQFGAIKNIDEAISIIGSTTNTEYKDAGIAGGVGLTIEGDNTNQSIKVSVTGDASDDIIWSVFLNVFTTGYKQPYSIIYEDGNNIITEASDNLTTQINI